MQQACNVPGSTLNLRILPGGGGGWGLAGALLDILQLCRLDSSAIMQQLHKQQEQRLETAALASRTCPSKGAATCKNGGWFLRSNARRRVQERYSCGLLSASIDQEDLLNTALPSRLPQAASRRAKAA